MVWGFLQQWRVPDPWKFNYNFIITIKARMVLGKCRKSGYIKRKSYLMKIYSCSWQGTERLFWSSGRNTIYYICISSYISPISCPITDHMKGTLTFSESVKLMEIAMAGTNKYTWYMCGHDHSPIVLFSIFVIFKDALNDISTTCFFLNSGVLQLKIYYEYCRLPARWGLQ